MFVFIVIVILFILILIGLNYFLRRYVVFQPPELVDYQIPAKVIDDTYKGVNFWYFNQFRDRPIILYCHGNSAIIPYCRWIMNLANKYQFNLIVFDYKGYGISDQILPSINSVNQDGQTIYNYLTKTVGISSDNIVIWGISLGGEVASYLASRNPCKCLILESTFYSIYDVVLRAKGYFLAWLSFMSLGYISKLGNDYANIRCPTIVIHSREDVIIPYQSGLKLYDAIGSPNKELISTTGLHAEPYLSSGDMSTILKLMNS